MMQLFKMAYRDLGRNRRRSFFSALALGIGLALLLLMASFVAGEMRQALDASVNLQTGHLQVRAKTYDDVKTSLAWEDLVENPQAVAAQIAALPPVKAATPRLFASGIIATGDESQGVRVIGIDPASEANAPYRDGLLSGSYITADDREGVYMGQALADKLDLKAGDQINILVNTANGDVSEQRFTIRGTYTTHMPSYDQASLFMPLAKAQAITQAEDRASTIFVLLKDKDQTDAVVAALKTNQYEVKTWSQMNELLVTVEQFSGAAMAVLYLIVLGITATVIINTLAMAVFERTREIGILSAIGMRGSRIMAMFFAESSLLAVGGIAIGLVLGGILVWYASVYGFYLGNLGMTNVLLGERIRGYLTLNDAVTLTVLTFVITLLAALYPALLAARMEPVDALRGGKQV